MPIGHFPRECTTSGQRILPMPPPTPQPWAGVLSSSSRAPSSSPKELEEHTSPPLQENELRGVGSAGRMRSYANECKVAANPSLLFLNLPLSSGR